MNNKTDSKLNLGLGGIGTASNAIRALKNKSSTSAPLSTGDTLIEVDLNLVDFDQQQYRQDQQDYDLEGLAANIYEVGLTKLPSLEPQSNGRWLVTDGEMRTRAYLLNHKKYPNDSRFNKLPAISRKIESLPGLDQRSTRDVIQLSANLFSDPGNVFDIADKLVELETKHGSKIVKQLMADMDQSHSKVDMSRWRSVAKVPVVIRSDVKANLIKDKETISTLAKIHKKDEVAYQKIITGYQGDSLTQSLAKTVKQTWSQVKGGNKPEKVDKPQLVQRSIVSNEQPRNPIPNEQPSKPISQSSSLAETSSVIGLGAMKLQALGVELKGNQLIITAAHGQLIQIELPESVDVSVNERG